MRARARHRTRGIARAAGLPAEAYVGLDRAEVVPFSDDDDPLRVLSARGGERRPGDVSFLLARLRNERLVRARLIFAPELRDAVRAAVSA